MATHKKDMNVRGFILDAVKEHIIRHLSGKNTGREMWEALAKICQSDNHNRKMMLRDKLGATRMFRSNTVDTYLTKIMQIRDELVALGEKVTDQELVRTTLNGFTKP